MNAIIKLICYTFNHKIKGNSYEEKTLDSEMVTLYTSCFVKQNCQYVLPWTDVMQCVMTILFLNVGGIL